MRKSTVIKPPAESPSKDAETKNVDKSGLPSGATSKGGGVKNDVGLVPIGPTPRTDRSSQSVPTSLEGERRKAMMLIHQSEKLILNFKERFFKRPKNYFS